MIGRQNVGLDTGLTVVDTWKREHFVPIALSQKHNSWKYLGRDQNWLSVEIILFYIMLTSGERGLRNTHIRVQIKKYETKNSTPCLPLPPIKKEKPETSWVI